MPTITKYGLLNYDIETETTEQALFDETEIKNTPPSDTNIHLPHIHGDLPLLISLLRKTGIIKLNSTTFRKLYNLFLTPPQNLTAEEVQEFSNTLSEIEVPYRGTIRFLGNLFLNDKGNDYFTLLFLNTLKKSHIKLRFILGTSEMQLLYYHSILRSVEQDKFDTLPGELRGFCEKVDHSFLNLVALIYEKQISLSNYVNLLYSVFLKNAYLFDFLVEKDHVTVFSSGAVNIETFLAMSKKIELPTPASVNDTVGFLNLLDKVDEGIAKRMRGSLNALILNYQADLKAHSNSESLETSSNTPILQLVQNVGLSTTPLPPKVNATFICGVNTEEQDMTLTNLSPGPFPTLNSHIKARKLSSQYHEDNEVKAGGTLHTVISNLVSLPHPLKKPELKPHEKHLAVLGDLHGNSLTLLQFLKRHCVIHLSKKEYSVLKKLYKKLPSTYTSETIAQLKEAISRILIINQDCFIVLLGDILCDRGYNDYMTLLILSHLKKNNISIQIPPSNHDIEFLLRAKVAGDQKIFNRSEDNQYSEYYSIRQHINEIATPSSNSITHFLKQGLVTNEELSSLIYSDFTSFIKFIPYKVEGDNITLFIHAPVGLEYLAGIALEFGIYFDFSSKESFLRSIDAINESVDFSNRAQLDAYLIKYFQKVSLKQHPYLYGTWNRVDTYMTFYQENSQSYRVYIIHGHIGDPSSIPHERLLNLDSNFGKEVLNNSNPCVEYPYKDWECQFDPRLSSYQATSTRSRIPQILSQLPSIQGGNLLPGLPRIDDQANTSSNTLPSIHSFHFAPLQTQKAKSPTPKPEEKEDASRKKRHHKGK